MPPNSGGAQPVVLTRLHVRYTASTFPEDLMFSQTKDRQNWQTRYVVQNPHEGSVPQCSAKVGQMDCEAMCRPRVAHWLNAPPLQYDAQNSGGNDGDGRNRQMWRDRDPRVLQRDCVTACAASKQAGVDAASRYYQSDLPRRLNAEKQTLARLTGWRMDEIDALPGALRLSRLVSPTDTTPTTPPSPGNNSKPWWEQLFKTGSAVQKTTGGVAANWKAGAGVSADSKSTAARAALETATKVGS